jgi:hypothetical protein
VGKNEYDFMVLLSTSLGTRKSSHFLNVTAISGARSVDSAAGCIVEASLLYKSAWFSASGIFKL